MRYGIVPSGYWPEYYWPYAVYTPPATYTITYNVNGSETGQAPVDNQAYLGDMVATISFNVTGLSLTNYRFRRWNTAADGSGTVYPEGSHVYLTGNLTLYAEWEQVYWPVTEVYATERGFKFERSYECIKCHLVWKETNMQMYQGKPYGIPCGCYRDIAQLARRGQK